MPTAAMRRVTESGSRRTPVSKALRPSATDRNSGTEKKRPAWIMNWKKNMVIPPASWALRSIEVRTSGSLPAASTRCSHQKKIDRTTAPQTMNTRVNESPQSDGADSFASTHPHSADRSTPYTARPRPAADRITPGTSMRWRAPSASTSLIRRLSRTIAATMTTSPANTRRQVQSVVTAPPINGPAATAMAPAEATRP